MVLFFFMMVFMDTTATIPTGAMAERWAWKNFVLYGLWIACLIVSTPTGFGAADFLLRAASIGVSAMARSISPDPASFTRWAELSRSRARWYSGRALANTIRRVARAQFPCHNVPMVVARNFHPRFRLVRLQSRFDFGGHRFAHQSMSSSIRCSPVSWARSVLMSRWRSRE